MKGLYGMQVGYVLLRLPKVKRAEIFTYIALKKTRNSDLFPVNHC
jgi:hypothetical protein